MTFYLHLSQWIKSQLIALFHFNEYQIDGDSHQGFKKNIELLTKYQCGINQTIMVCYLQDWKQKIPAASTPLNLSNFLHQGHYVVGLICLFVGLFRCLSFSWHLVSGCSMSHGIIKNILDQIRITGWYTKYLKIQQTSAHLVIITSHDNSNPLGWTAHVVA